MSNTLTDSEKQKFFQYLRVPDTASIDEVKAQMKLATAAQNVLCEAGRTPTPPSQDPWVLKLFSMGPIDAYLFWYYFYAYDAEYSLGFLDDFTKGLKIVGSL